MHSAYGKAGDSPPYHDKCFTVEHALSYPFGGFHISWATSATMSDSNQPYNPSFVRFYTTAPLTLKTELVLTSRHRDSWRTIHGVHFSLTYIYHSSPSSPTTDSTSKKEGGLWSADKGSGTYQILGAWDQLPKLCTRRLRITILIARLLSSSNLSYLYFHTWNFPF